MQELLSISMSDVGHTIGVYGLPRRLWDGLRNGSECQLGGLERGEGGQVALFLCYWSSIVGCFSLSESLRLTGDVIRSIAYEICSTPNPESWAHLS